MRNAGVNECELAARNTFTVKRHARLQRMRDIVVNMDVLPEKLGAQTISEKAALILHGRCTEIAEHLAHQIEHSRGFQDHGVSARRYFSRVV